MNGVECPHCGLILKKRLVGKIKAALVLADHMKRLKRLSGGGIRVKSPGVRPPLPATTHVLNESGDSSSDLVGRNATLFCGGKLALPVFPQQARVGKQWTGSLAG